uniref:SKP1 component POZ domain-containing protein n=1 Tax=Anopheles culicifacies TaxID=139723 RepID=A0A182M6B6_9DIPT
MEKIKLKSKDGKIVTAKRSILKRSEVLQKRLDELIGAAENCDTLDVPEADGDCLRKIVQWLERQEVTYDGSENDSTEVMIPNNQEQNLVPFAGISGTMEGGTFDKEMFTSFPHMCVLMAAANRLRVQDIINDGVRFVIGWKEGKNLEDIREMMENGATNIRGSLQVGDGTGLQH